jgi:hypothetical protein
MAIANMSHISHKDEFFIKGNEENIVNYIENKK